MKAPVVEIITSSLHADVDFLQSCIKRFADLMTDVLAEPMAYEGLALDIILSLLAFRFQCRPEGLSGELRRLCDAMDKGNYIQTDAPRKN